MKFSCKPELDHNSTTDMMPLVRWQEKVFLAVIVFVLLLIELRAAALRPLWFDELSTLTVSSVPTIRGMLRAMSADGNPPLYFLLARFCLHLPMPVEIALRLPSIAASDITALMIFLFVRRNTGSIFAFLAMSVFLGSPFMPFATLEARSYALLLCFTSVAICCWQSAAQGMSRRLALAGITASMAGAIFSHHYGVIYVTLPLLAGEGVRAWQRHRIDFAVFTSMLAGAATLIITFPPMLHGQAGLLKAVKLCPVFWSRPGIMSLLLYLDTVPIPSLTSFLAAVLLCVFLRYVVFARNRISGALTQPASRVRIQDLAAASALVLVLPIMLLVTKLGTGYFWGRYAIGSSLGVALVSGLLFSRLNVRSPGIKAFVLTVIIYSFSTALFGFWRFGPSDETSGVQSHPIFLSAPAREPIVIADAVIFWPTWWYSDPGTRARLHYLSDLSYAVKQPDFIPEYALTLEQPYGAPKLDNYMEFLGSHQQFLLYCSGIPRLEWVKSRLSNDGWHLIPINSSGKEVLYQVDRP